MKTMLFQHCNSHHYNTETVPHGSCNNKAADQLSWHFQQFSQIHYGDMKLHDTTLRHQQYVKIADM